MTTYRVSALAFGLIRMWRGWSVVLVAVVANALLQAVLVIPGADPATFGFWLLAFLSALVFAASFGLITAVALLVADGHVGWDRATAALRAHGRGYLLYAVGLLVAFTAGLTFGAIPGLVVLAITPFLLLAALDGQRNPLAANFHAMGQRFWRWLVTVIIVGIAVLVGTLLMGLTGFFVRGALASFLSWLVAGLVISWFQVTWGLIYRSTTVAAGARPAATPVNA